MNNNANPGCWKKGVLVHIYKRGDRSADGKYKPVNLISVVCKQMDHVSAGKLKQVWEMSGCLYEGQHDFRTG